jgi:uncharacterized protein
MDGSMRAAEVAAALGLIAHPEGGYFLETYRSGAKPMESKGATDMRGHLVRTDALSGAGRFTAGGDGVRNVATSILYMMTRDAPYARVIVNESDTIHYWQGGSAMRYHLAHEDGRVETVELGPNFQQGQVLQLFVGPGTYKAAAYAGDERADFALVGEAVAPGFDHRDMAYVAADALRARCGEAAFERFKPHYARDAHGRGFEDFYE